MKRALILLFCFTSIKSAAIARPETPEYKRFKDQGITLECYTDRQNYLKIIITSEENFNSLDSRTETVDNLLKIYIEDTLITQLEFFEDFINFQQKLSHRHDETILKITLLSCSAFSETIFSKKFISDKKYILVIPGFKDTDISPYLK